MLDAAALGLGASIAWGVADFLGGVKSRAHRVLTVLVCSQLAALALLTGLVLATGDPAPGRPSFYVYAVCAGVAESVGIGAFYRALAKGAMGVVSTIAATAPVVPLAIGLATGERPTVLQFAGAALAIGAVTTLGRRRGQPPVSGSRSALASFPLAIAAALAFGAFFPTIAAAGDTSVVWALFISRVTAVVLIVGAAAWARPEIPWRSREALALGAIGLIELAASGLFVAGSRLGLVSLVAVLSSLYPVVTALLARVVLGERIAPFQRFAIAAGMIGVVLITSGGSA